MNNECAILFFALILASSVNADGLDMENISTASPNFATIQLGNDWQRPSIFDDGPEPTELFSDSCAPMPDPNVIHAFDPDSLREAERSPEVSMVVAHGARPDEGAFPYVYHFMELMPVFLNEKRRKTDFTVEEIKSILTGRIGNWKKLDTKSGRIRIYLHGGKLQRLKFIAFLSSIGVKLESAGSVAKHYMSTYQELARAAADDPNAIVFGLAKWEAVGLGRVRIDGLDARIGEHTSSYPMRFPMYIGVKNQVGARKLFAAFMRQMYEVRSIRGRLELTQQMEFASQGR